MSAIPPPQVWNFDAETPGTLPRDFVIGSLFDGRPAGEWRLFRTSQAKSPPQVFAQVMGKGTDLAYKIVLINGTTAADVDVGVSFLALDGTKDRGGGLLWRATDDRNYYVVRANVLEQTINLARLTDGLLQPLQTFPLPLTAQEWHVLRVVHRGCQLQIWLDNQRLFSLCDQSFTVGRIGLWTKADAVTYFDDLQFQRLK